MSVPLRTLLAELKGRVKRHESATWAAGAAFKVFLSLFPALIAAVAVWSLFATPGDLERLLSAATGVLPAAAADLLAAPLEDLTRGDGTAAGTVAVTGVFAGLWAATSAAVTIMRALNHSVGTVETRGPVRQRGAALVLTAVLFVAMVALVVLLVAGPLLQERLLPVALANLAWLVTLLRYVAALVVGIALLAVVYAVGPDRPPPPWRDMVPGALLGVVGWLVVSSGFALYARTAGDYNATYGSIAGVIVTLLWLQLTMLVLLLGAELNAAIRSLRERSPVDAVGVGAAGPLPPGEREGQRHRVA